MTERLTKLTTLLVSTAISAFPSASLTAAEPATTAKEYTAVYQVLRNDKNLAEVTVRLSEEDGVWTLHGFTHDLQGLADLLNVKGVQTVTGRWLNGGFVPENYDFSFSLIGYKSNWNANFDWSAGIVTTRTKSGKSELPLASGAVDPFSLSLNISSHLASNQGQVAVDVIDEDEIENHVYEAEREEPVNTALGCLQTTRVKRIRKSSKRTSLVWYANDHSYVPVLAQHFKKKDKGLKLQIISLNVAGQPVHPVASCANLEAESRQSGLG